MARINLSIFNFNLMKRFIFIALVNALVGIIILVSVNFKIDSANVFNPESFYSSVTKNLSKGQNIIFNGNWDERLFKKHLLLSNNKYDAPLFVIGSSRAMQINSEMLNTPILNIGVSGAALQDYLGFYSMIKTTKKTSKILLVIDPWVFNKNNGEFRWISLKNEMDSYFYQNTLNNPYINQNIYSDRLLNLFSFSYLQENIKIIINPKKSYKLTLDNESYSDNIYRYDGSLKYSNKYHSRDTNEIKLQTTKYVQKDIYHMSNFNEIDSTVIIDFIKQIIKDKNQLFILLMPFNPQIYSELSKKVPNIEKSEDFIYKLGSNLNIPVKGSFNPANLDITTNCFLDAMHLKNNGIQKVMTNTKIQHLIQNP